MKIIFLDIDGVLNCDQTTQMITGGYLGIDPKLVVNLNMITDAHPDAKIVISSSWRKKVNEPEFGNFDGLKKYLAAQGVKGEIIDHTPIYFGDRDRGSEIRAWLNRYSEVTKTKPLFVILDDDTSGMAPYVPVSPPLLAKHGVPLEEDEPELDLRPNHVRTWMESGLTEEKAQKAIETFSVLQAFRSVECAMWGHVRQRTVSDPLSPTCFHCFTSFDG